MALLDKSGPLPDTLPPLGHWLPVPRVVRQSELDLDGHPRRGGEALLPPIALPRRMWPASDVTFDNPIRISAAIVRHTRALFVLAMHDDRRWIGDADGTTAMTADIAWA